MRGARQPGSYSCPQRSTPVGQALWQAWVRRWMLLQAKELELYALSATEGEYLRRSGAVFVRSVVTRAVVSQFRLRQPGSQPRAAAAPGMSASAAPAAGQRGPPPKSPQRVVAQNFFHNRRRLQPHGHGCRHGHLGTRPHLSLPSPGQQQQGQDPSRTQREGTAAQRKHSSQRLPCPEQHNQPLPKPLLRSPKPKRKPSLRHRKKSL